MAKKEKENTNKTETPVESNNKGKAGVKKVEEPKVITLSKDKKEVPFDQVIDEKRKGLFSMYKKTSRMSTILMFGVVVIFVVAFIIMPQPGWGQPVCWTLVGVTLVGMILYFIFTKNLYPNASKEYFAVFWQETNDYLFSATEFSDCKIDTMERYVLPEVITDGVYKDIIDSASRNIIHGLYKGKGFTFGELAYYVAGPKRNTKDVKFVGRHLAMDNNLKFEGRYIVNIRNAEPVDLPNNIDDLVELVSNNNFVIYGPKDAKPEKDLGKELLNNLKAIECKAPLLNVNVTFVSGKTTAYLSFDDTIAAIPFEKPMNVPSYEALRRIINDIFAILESK